MPAALESCVASLQAKWKKDPASRPKPRGENQDAKSQAFAICTAALKKSGKMEEESIAIMLGDGVGPALVGLAATNRPYIPQLDKIEVVERDGEKWFKCHLANAGFFSHPLGAFKLNRSVFAAMQRNFSDNVVGQDLAFDARHKPDYGALGWLREVFLSDEGKRFFAWVQPTKKGLEVIEDGQFRYCSMEFRRNYSRDDVVLDLERAGDFCPANIVDDEIIELAFPDSEETQEREQEIGDEEMTEELEKAQARMLELEQKLEQEREKAQAERERVIALETQAIDTAAKSVVSLAMSRGLNRGLIEWIDTVLKFGEIKEGDDTVRLSDEDMPTMSVRRYLIDAAMKLVSKMEPSVPLEQTTDTSARDDSDKDDFNYADEWKEV